MLPAGPIIRRDSLGLQEGSTRANTTTLPNHLWLSKHNAYLPTVHQVAQLSSPGRSQSTDEACTGLDGNINYLHCSPTAAPESLQRRSHGPLSQGTGSGNAGVMSSDVQGPCSPPSATASLGERSGAAIAAAFRRMAQLAGAGHRSEPDMQALGCSRPSGERTYVPAVPALARLPPALPSPVLPSTPRASVPSDAAQRLLEVASSGARASHHSQSDASSPTSLGTSGAIPQLGHSSPVLPSPQAAPPHRTGGSVCEVQEVILPGTRNVFYDYPTSSGAVPAPRWGHSGVVVGDTLYIYGGVGAAVYGDVHAYDTGEHGLHQQTLRTPDQ